MKKHLRLICLAFIAMIVPLAVHAQEDVTATYLTNPSFEEGETFFHDTSYVVVGWEVSDLAVSYRNNDADGSQDGTYIFGIWSPTAIGDFEIAQSVDSLPAGTYIISCLMTVPTDNNTTQRLFATSKAGGTKAVYFASSSLDTVAGEDYTFAGLAVDGDGTGPFKELSVRIKVAEGDTLVFGVRTNGVLSTICPFSELGGEGWFKTDNFKLSYLSDETAYSKAQIQLNIDAINAVSLDSIPGGYASQIEAIVAEAENVLEVQNDADSLDAYNEELLDFISLLSSAKTVFKELMEVLITAEDLIYETDLSGKDSLQAAYDAAFEVYYAYESLIPDFEAAITALDAAIHVYSDGRIQENLALLESVTVTTSFVSSWEDLSAIYDGYTPISSTDRTYPVYGNWNGEADYGLTNWVQYEWPLAHSIKEISVYWFSDGGGLAQPTATNVEYWQSNEWVSAGAIDTLLNQFNTMTVDFKTTKVRLSMSSGTSTGICEFKVMGLQKLANDIDDYKAMIQDELTSINATNLDSIPKGYGSLVTTYVQKGENMIAYSENVDSIIVFIDELEDFNALLDSAGSAFIELADLLTTAKDWIDGSAFDSEEVLQQAYDNASAVFIAAGSLVADFNSSITSLEEAIYNYTVGHIVVNLATIASVSTSYVSSWETLEAVNDGYEPASSADNSNGIYGNWLSTDAYGTSNWLQYEWPVAHQITGLSVYWYSDGDGITLPSTDSIEYWDGSEWKLCGSIGTYGDQFNDTIVNFSASKIRLSMTSVSATGIIEFRVTGYETPVGIVSPVKQSDLVTIYPTILKRGATLNINFSEEMARPVSVEMFSISGQKVCQTSVSGKSSSFNVPGSLSSGIYLMMFNVPDGRLMKKVVIE